MGKEDKLSYKIEQKNILMKKKEQDKMEEKLINNIIRGSKEKKIKRWGYERIEMRGSRCGESWAIRVCECSFIPDYYPSLEMYCKKKRERRDWIDEGTRTRSVTEQGFIEIIIGVLDSQYPHICVFCQNQCTWCKTRANKTKGEQTAYLRWTMSIFPMCRSRILHRTAYSKTRSDHRRRHGQNYCSFDQRYKSASTACVIARNTSVWRYMEEEMCRYFPDIQMENT